MTTGNIIRRLPALLALAVTVTAAAPATGAGEPDEVDLLVTEALERNPELEAISAQVRALEHRRERAEAWVDPRLTLSYQNVPIDEPLLGREPMSMVNLRVEQTIPWFGKRAKRGAVIEEAAKSRRQALAENKVKLRALVKQSYYRLGLARQLAELTREHLGLVDQLIDQVRVKYEVARAEQHSLLRLQLLRDRLADSLEGYTRDEQELTAALNTARHRPPATPIATPGGFTLPRPTHSQEELYQLALADRPALAALAATAEMHRLSARLVRAEATPDVTLFASYGLRLDMPSGTGGRDLVTVGVSVPLSFFNDARYQAPAREELELARGVEAERRALADQIGGGIAEALATWRRAVSQSNNYRDTLVPGGRRTLDAVLVSYQVDRADFASLYDAELDLIELERTLRRITVAGLIAASEIEMLVGKELP